MDFFNLDLIRLGLDGAICLGCLVLMVRLRRQRQLLSGRDAPGGLSEFAEPLPQLPKDAPDARFSSPPTPDPVEGATPVGAMKGEVLRLIQSGQSVTEIARRTGLSRGEVELIRKFSPRV